MRIDPFSTAYSPFSGRAAARKPEEVAAPPLQMQGNATALKGAEPTNSTATAGTVKNWGLSAPAMGPLPLNPELPTPKGVAAKVKGVGSDFRMVLAVAGISTDPPIRMKLDGQGSIILDADDPQSVDVQKLLTENKSLAWNVSQLVREAQRAEETEATTAWHEQVSAGTSPQQANRAFTQAHHQISAASGFSLSGEELSFDVTGMGRKLMGQGGVGSAEDEIMFRETLRLTDRATTREAEMKEHDGKYSDSRSGTDGDTTQPLILHGP
ncbi:hypothetical protein GCM10011317_52390 [Niveispirillum cyanobacteriorum]|nr:hypothetical protein GCM10011317_52390 [Niveispirillum cyanobacteriorum]